MLMKMICQQFVSLCKVMTDFNVKISLKTQEFEPEKSLKNQEFGPQKAVRTLILVLTCRYNPKVIRLPDTP